MKRGWWWCAAMVMLPHAALAQLRCPAARAYHAAHRGMALLALRDGKTMCETHESRDAAELWSGTKSIVGLAAAAAVQDGLLTLDERVSDSLPDWRDAPLKRDATIRQLLSMTAGLPSEIGRPPGYDEAAAMPFNAAPGSRFQYGPAPIQAFGAVLARKLQARGHGESPQAYIERRLFRPIGLHYARWRTGPDGAALLPQGLVLRAREWARLGEFVRHRGRVAGRMLVDPAAFAALFRGTAANPAYGLTWWIPKGPPSDDPVTRTIDIASHAAALPADLVVAAGAGDQRLYVIPSRRLVIVRQASIDPQALASLKPVERPPGERWSDTRFLTLFFDDQAGNARRRHHSSPGGH